MRWLAALALAGCSGSSELHIDRVTPPYGPVGGGTRIVLEGDGFTAETRVLVGDREAPLAAASRDGRKLDVVLPPADRPGPASISALDGTAIASAPDGFIYAPLATIDSVSPAKLLPSTFGPTLVTLTGSGFQDEGAGDAVVLVDGVPATDIAIQDDTHLSFIAPDGPMLSQPTITVINNRGTASYERAFRYVPTLHPGLVIFPNYTGELAVFYDVVDHRAISIARTVQATSRYTSVVLDGRGDFVGIDRGGRFGRIDMRTGNLVDPLSSGHVFPAMTLSDGQVLAIDRFSATLGKYDPSTGVFATWGTESVGCCGSFGLASDGSTVYVTDRAASGLEIRAIDANSATGVFGPSVPLQGNSGFQPEELRVLDHVIYATSRDSTLCTIDPTTGAVSVVTGISRASAMEVLP